MGENFINITEDNIGSEHLCCIIRSKKPHPGVEAKRGWLRGTYSESLTPRAAASSNMRRLNMRGRR